MFSRGEGDRGRVKWVKGVSNMVKDGNQTFVGELTSRSRNKVEIKIKILFYISLLLVESSSQMFVTLFFFFLRSFLELS